MAGYLCIWKLDGAFRWLARENEMARSWAGEKVNRRWNVNNHGIEEGSRIFLKTSGTRGRPAIERGLIASGFAIRPPRNLRPITPNSVVYQDYPLKQDGTEHQDTVQVMRHFVFISFDVILDPSQALSVNSLKSYGNLGAMYWSAPGSGVQIRPKETQTFRGELMPELEQVWANHLNRIRFPVH